MPPITPRDIARSYVDEERRINCSRLDVDHPVIIIGPDGTPMTAAWLSWGVRGEMILQVKPEKGINDETEV